MTCPPRLSRNRGVAFGVILFVIAVIVLIAAAVAAGSGSFNINMASESTKVEASKIIEFGNRVNSAVTLMEGRYSVPDYGWNAQHNGIGWATQCTSTTCAIWCDSSLGSSQTCMNDMMLLNGDFISNYQGAGGMVNESANIYLTPIIGVGAAGKGQIVLEILGLTQNLCKEINRALGFGSIAPIENAYASSQYIMASTTITEPTGNTIGTTATQFVGATSFCVGNGNFSSTEFDYVNVLMMR